MVRTFGGQAGQVERHLEMYRAGPSGPEAREGTVDRRLKRARRFDPLGRQCHAGGKGALIGQLVQKPEAAS